MINKVKTLLSKGAAYLYAKVNVKGVKNASMRVIVFVCITYTLLVYTYLAGWLYMWIYQEKLQLEPLLALIKEFISPAAVAFFTFLAASFVDADKDGIPDKFQDKEEKNE